MDVFERERPRLLSVAYGLLGSYSEAEDAVQEAWLRYRSAAGEVRQPEAWLTTVVSRIALDELRSAKRRREVYPGEWLPEPVSALPDVEVRQSMLSLGFLHLLEKLGPEERAVLVLREAFDRSYEEIAEVVQKSEAACRQILSRAKKRLEQDGPRQPVPESLVRRCVEAIASEDEHGLLALLAGEAVLYSDGGGKVRAALNPIYGAERVVRFFFGLKEKFPDAFRFEIGKVNGEPGVLVHHEGRVSALAFSFDGERITQLHLVVNPEKLTNVASGPRSTSPATS